MKKFLILCVCMAFLGTSAAAWFQQKINQPLAMASAVVVELPKGAGVRTLSDNLQAAKVDVQPLLVQITSRIYGYDRQLKAGEYQIDSGMSLKDVFELITSGKTILHRMTLPEGLTTAQILTIVAENPFLSGEVSESAAEGELLPETYTFAKGTPRNDIIKNAKTAMSRALERVWNNRASGLPVDNPAKLLILASIIEKETAVENERRKVSSVFINRLNAGMLLQTDPTVIYALTLGKEDLGRSLTRKDLQIDSPYNTYKYAGLPPKPICNPGLKSLQAAANPEATDYYYFVANGSGGHNFSKNLAEHNQNVLNWRAKTKR